MTKARGFHRGDRQNSPQPMYAKEIPVIHVGYVLSRFFTAVRMYRGEFTATVKSPLMLRAPEEDA